MTFISLTFVVCVWAVGESYGNVQNTTISTAGACGSAIGPGLLRYVLQDV